MKIIKSIGLITFKESIRNKIIINIFVFAFFIFLLSMIVGSWSLGEQLKVITDLGLTGLHLISLLIAIFVGITLVSKEIGSRTIYNTLSKSIKRWQFLIGKFLGLSLTILLNIFIIGLILMILLSFYKGAIDVSIFIPVLFIYFEMLIVVAISIFFSTFNNATLSAIYTIFIYIVGHMFQSVIEYLNQIAAESMTVGLSVLKNTVGILHWIIPNLSLFNVAEEYVYHTPITFTYFLWVLIYTVLYLSFLLIVSSLIFNKKDLK